jgi:DeoR/GlpR family transcriptional regulator of sugar metabolism
MPMKYRKQRLNHILEMLNQTSFATVDQLSGQFGVCAATIRRDLMLLEQEGKLKRVHGGMTALTEPENAPVSIAAPKVNIPNLEIKQRIARKAVTMIRENDTVLMDGGTTNLMIARQIAADFHDLTIVTTSIDIACTFNRLKSFSIYICGANLLGNQVASNETMTLGPIVDAMIANFRANICFLGTFGIHVTQGVTVKNMLQSHLKNIMINNSSQSVLVADHSKFGKINPVFQCPVDRFNHLITDAAAPQLDLEALKETKLQIHLV